MSQLYLVTVKVDLPGYVEENNLCVSAASADQASDAACVYCQIAPSMAQVDTKRVSLMLSGERENGIRHLFIWTI